MAHHPQGNRRHSQFEGISPRNDTGWAACFTSPPKRKYVQPDGCGFVVSYPQRHEGTGQRPVVCALGESAMDELAWGDVLKLDPMELRLRCYFGFRDQK